jgi:polyisoprenoid-binding protein YceI
MANTKWVVDTAHSAIEFSVKHMMIARVRGSFHKFDASIEADPTDLTTASIQFRIDVSSIDTGNNDRDAHLRSADLFDVEQFPSITFDSTKIVKTGENEYDVTGNLTIHGTTRPVTFAVTYEGQAKDPWGNVKVGFSGQSAIHRSDFGLTYNAVLETGGVLIGDEVKISIQIEASAQA